MNHKIDATGLVVGTSMATAPAMVDVPFYETGMWLGSVAVLGIIVLVVTAINGLLTLKKNVKESKNIDHESE